MLTSMKKQSNKQQSKKGVILVTILFIFCIATIFITCAIMMTANTRERLYDKAEISQCRLTVTSAAEAFYQALASQTITDAQFESFVGAGEKKLVVTGTSLPGLSTAADNCTVYKCTQGASANEIIVEFTTTIGDASDSIRLTLYKTPSSKQQPAFTQMVETAGDMNISQMAIGLGGQGKADNTVLVRGDAQIANGESSSGFYSNYVFLGRFVPHGGQTFRGDVVLWGTDAYLDFQAYGSQWDAATNQNITTERGNGSNGLKAGNVIFINPSNTIRAGLCTDVDTPNGAIHLYGDGPQCEVRNWGFVNTDAVFTGHTINNVLGNASNTDGMLFLQAQFDTSNQHALSGVSSRTPVVLPNEAQYLGAYQTFLAGDGTTAGHTNIPRGGDGDAASSQVKALTEVIRASLASSFSGETVTTNSFADRIDDYMSSTLADQINKQYPTLAKAQSEIFMLDGVDASSATPLQLSTLKSIAHTGDHKLPYNANGYIIKESTGGADALNAWTPESATNDYVIIDMTETDVNQFVIFIDAGKCVNFWEFRFVVLTDSADDFFKIVLLNGASVGFAGDNAASGIYSSTGRVVADVQNNGRDASGGTYSWRTHSAMPKPHSYIFGYGNNTVRINRGACLESYIGLYGGNSTVTANDATDANAFFLGRIMADTVLHTSGNTFNIPYCVGPNSLDQESGLIRIRSSYSVYGFEYYTPTVVTPSEEPEPTGT